MTSIPIPPDTGEGFDVAAEPETLLRLRMRCEDSAPSRARSALRTLAGIDPVRADAVLVASELVTNAVLHAGCGPSEEIELEVSMGPDFIRLAISDCGRSGNAPTLRGREYAGPGGLGLRVVEALARSWGSERGMGTLVWAELPLAPA